MRDLGIVIAIDGPAGTGKSSAGKLTAKRLGYSFLSTGEMYRALGCRVLDLGIDPADAQAVAEAAQKLVFTFERQEDASLKMFVDGEYLGDKLHDERVGQAASQTSAVPAARSVLTDIMRTMAKKGAIVMEGRDIGTVVAPDAEVKIYITAGAEQRAERRVKQLTARGESADYDAILASIKSRDERDSSRAVAPMKPAADAVLLDTSDINLEQAVLEIKKIIDNKLTPKDVAGQRSLNLIKWCFRWYLKTFFNAKAEGLENIPQTGRLIIVSNHLSNVDPPLLGGFAGLVRDSRYVIKRSLMSAPLLGRLFKLYRFIPVERMGRDMAAFKEIIRALKNEESIVMFPEGTRSKDGKPGRAKAGIGYVAHKANAPVLICRLFNTYGFPKVKDLRAVYSHTIRFEEKEGVDLKEQYQQFADRIMSEIYKVK